ncbi:MAG: hypothetical protein ACE5E6_09070 [Phycisphaerae bacterium]
MTPTRWPYALGVVWPAVAAAIGAQPGDPTSQHLRDDMRRLLERVETLERQRDADKARIADLEHRLADLERAPAAPSGPDATPPPGAQTPAIPPPPTAPGALGLTWSGGAPNALNPEITVFIDAGASVSSRGSNNALNRFNLREVEIDLRSAVSPSADGVLIIAIGEEIDQDVFGDVTIDTAVDVEEGYINFHSLPHDLSLKVGKFRNVFGRNNLLHTHDLPQVTRPLAVDAFLGPEGLMTTGASLSWLVPNPWDKYIEATLDVVNADGGDESPILADPNAENPAIVAHVKFFDDVGDTASLELGGTYLFGRASADADSDANVFGFDLTYHWVDPDPSRFKSILLQGEAFWAANDVDRGFAGIRRDHTFGVYGFAQYQLHRDWYVGLRGDYTEFPGDAHRGAGDADVAFSPYITWYINEFLRVRLEYQRRRFEMFGRSGDEDAVFLQFTSVIGAHPPHPYWVNR